MKVILHIGTHKTGTSSIQTILAANRDALASRGIYYPENRYSNRNVNFIGRDLAAKRYDEPAQYIKNSLKKARVSGCDTLLLSGESFYAMMGMFYLLQGFQVEDYWAQEEEAVRALSGMLEGVEVKVCCYVRRQDLFLDSLYNQFVKQSPGYAGDLNTFIRLSGPVADYAAHLDLWARIFGKEAIFAASYDALKGDLFQDFASRALGFDDVSGFKSPPQRINERLPTDLLLFKRILNRIEMPRAEGYMAYRTVARMAQSETGSASKGLSISDEERDALLKAHEDGNARVAKDYLHLGTSLLFERPVPSKVEIQAVTLSVERGLELYMRFRREMNRPSARFELVLRKTVRWALVKAPWLESLLGGVRKINNRRNAKREWR